MRWREGRNRGEGGGGEKGGIERREEEREGRDREEGGGEGNNDVDSEFIHPLILSPFLLSGGKLQLCV